MYKRQLLAWGALGVFVPKFTFNSRAVAIFIASIIFVVAAVAVDVNAKPEDRAFGLMFTLWALSVFVVLMFRVAILGIKINQGSLPKKNGWVEKLALKMSGATRELPANDLSSPSLNLDIGDTPKQINRWRGYVGLFVIISAGLFLLVAFISLLGILGFFAFCVILAIVLQLFNVKAEYIDSETGEVTPAKVSAIQLLDDFLRNPKIRFENTSAQKRENNNENLYFRQSRKRQYIPTKKATISQRASSKRSPYIDYGDGDDYHDIQNDLRWYEGERGREAQFDYVDTYGVCTARDVRNWVSNGPYIKLSLIHI